MTLWNPEYRVKVNGYTVTGVTLAGLTISSGRTDIYSQTQAGYCQISLLETDQTSVVYEINMPVTVEVKDSTGTYVYLFGGFISDLAITVATSGASAISQRINITAVGSLARLARTIFEGNLASNKDGDQIYSVLSVLLFDSWEEVPAATTWNDFDPTVTWQNALNNGLGEIDRPGQYDLDSQSNVLSDAYTLVSALAVSGLGYIYEDPQGRIGYADSLHRISYLSANGYVDLDGNHSNGAGLNIIKRSGDVRNSLTISYTSAGNSSITASDSTSINEFGELAASVQTTLKNQTDAEDQAAFYLSIRANPQYLMKAISFEVDNPEIDDMDRDSLLNVFMGMPLSIQNLPTNMVGGQFLGFVEGWTWRAAYNRLSLTMNLSPVAYSLIAFRWDQVPVTEYWNTIDPTLTWENATIIG